MKVNYPTEVIEQAKEQYLKEIPIRQIAENLGIKRFTTISRWVKQFQWVREISPETDKTLDVQLEIIEKLANKFNVLCESVDGSTMEDKDIVSTYLKILQHQLKLVKAKSVNQMPKETQSIFEFE